MTSFIVDKNFLKPVKTRTPECCVVWLSFDNACIASKTAE